MATQRDYYEILWVDKRADKKELKSAYRKMALKFHPDRNKAPDAEDKFKEVNEAYEILSNEEKRKAYDQFGHAAFDPRTGGFGGFGQGTRYKQGPFTYTYSTSGNPFGGAGFDFSDPFDIFEQFFGGGSPFGRQAQRRAHYSISIDFMEAIKGTKRTIIHQGDEHTVKIPPGANDGTRIQFNDFIVTIDVKPDGTFKRDGYDLFVDVPVRFTTAALGGTVNVPTIDGEVTLKVKAGTQPNTMIRLKGKGVPHLRGSGTGDAYVRMVVGVPTELTSKQKKLLKDLEKSL